MGGASSGRSQGLTCTLFLQTTHILGLGRVAILRSLPDMANYGFETVTGTVIEVAVSVTVKFTTVLVPLVPAQLVRAVTVNLPSVVKVVVEIVTRLPFDDAVTL